MTPLILYRVKRPVKDLNKLPVIPLAKFYEQSKAEHEQIAFTVKKVQLGGERGKNYLSYISDEETRKSFEDLSLLSADDDRQLMNCLDKFISTDLKDKEISDVRASDLDFKKFDFRNEKLKKLSKELLEMRSDLFLKFTK